MVPDWMVPVALTVGFILGTLWFVPIWRHRIREAEGLVFTLTKETVECPDCGLKISYDVNKLGSIIETWVPGACPRCGACLK